MHLLKRLAIWVVVAGPRLPGDLAPRLFNWGMSDYGPRRAEADS